MSRNYGNTEPFISFFIIRLTLHSKRIYNL